MFMVRLTMMKDLVNDPAWLERLNNAKSLKEGEKIIVEYAKKHGWEVREVR